MKGIKAIWDRLCGFIIAPLDLRLTIEKAAHAKDIERLSKEVERVTRDSKLLIEAQKNNYLKENNRLYNEMKTHIDRQALYKDRCISYMKAFDAQMTMHEMVMKGRKYEAAE